jgi:DNA-binding CsgD family transcriptional regulator
LAQATPDARFLFSLAAELQVGRGEFQAADAHLELIKDHSRSLAGTPEAAREYAVLAAELGLWQGRLEEAQAAVQEGLDRVAETDERVRSGRLLWLGMRIQADRAELGRARHHQGEVHAAIRAAGALASRAAAMAPNPLVPGATPFWRRRPARSRPWSGGSARGWRAARTRPSGRRQPQGGWRLAGPTRPRMRTGDRPRRCRFASNQQAAPWSRSERRTRPPCGLAHDRSCARSGRWPGGARITLEGPPAEPAPTPSPVEQFGLTARELEVLRYVAAGRSNREIGDALFITPKTASVHISNILRKLQVTSRVQAATAAHRLGLVDEDAPEATS